MKVVFFCKDRFYAEGLCILLENIYEEQCYSIFFNFNEASLLRKVRISRSFLPKLTR